MYEKHGRAISWQSGGFNCTSRCAIKITKKQCSWNFDLDIFNGKWSRWPILFIELRKIPVA